jgi:hypothetical protein
MNRVDHDMNSVTLDPPRVARSPRLVERVVCVGGHPGCGKTMLTPIVGALARVEIQKFNYALEHMCTLALLGRLDQDVADTMVKMLTDLDLYHLTMSREVNFRHSDLSSVFKNPDPWRYVRRLMQKGDAAAFERAQQTRPILHYVIHNLLVISPAMFRALGDRLRIIEVIRHPLYMVKQWRLYVELYGTDGRDFTIWIDHNGQALPFFAHGWEQKYLSSPPMDRVIYAIHHLSQMEKRVMAQLTPAEREQVLFVPFERYVLGPDPYMRSIEALLGTEVTDVTRREMKRQRVPRQRIADGIARPIYKQYGWQPPEAGLSERDELARRRAFVAKEASPEALALLDEMCREYEVEHLDGGAFLDGR